MTSTCTWTRIAITSVYPRNESPYPVKDQGAPEIPLVPRPPDRPVEEWHAIFREDR